MRRLLLALVIALTLPSAAPAATNPWLAKRVLSVAHQGGEDEFPSNTLYAFKRSVGAGADMLELDVGATLEGKVVASHDTTLDRVTNGRGTIASHTLKQIRKLDGAAAFLFAGGSPGEGVVALQLPITYQLGDQTLSVTNAENVARSHRSGYAWHTWLSDDGESPATWTQLIDWCVDGVMTARPVAFEKVLRSHPAPVTCG